MILMRISADVVVLSHGLTCIQISPTSSLEHLISLLCLHKPATQTDKRNSHSLTLISDIHSSSILSDYRSKASSKTIPPRNAI